MKKSEHEQTKRAEIFGDLLYAAMLSAAVERKLTQLKTELTPPETGRRTVIRIIIVPETMDYDWPQGLGSK